VSTWRAQADTVVATLALALAAGAT